MKPKSMVGFTVLGGKVTSVGFGLLSLSGVVVFTGEADRFGGTVVRSTCTL